MKRVQQNSARLVEQLLVCFEKVNKVREKGKFPTSIESISLFVDNLPSQPAAEIPIKTRYATRYSTRLAAAVIHEEKTVRRQTTRLTSE